jgi:CheY-like chemotaxis protein
LKTNSPDIIFMDCLMPDMDGFETTRKIKELPGCDNIPIIALTANAMAEDKDRCSNAGMDGFVSKPFSKDDLRTVLNEYLSELKKLA